MEEPGVAAPGWEFCGVVRGLGALLLMRRGLFQSIDGAVPQLARGFGNPGSNGAHEWIAPDQQARSSRAVSSFERLLVRG